MQPVRQIGSGGTDQNDEQTLPESEFRLKKTSVCSAYTLQNKNFGVAVKRGFLKDLLST